ncbi:hypothetical protein GE061_012943 [Apolygus lucorum]|uniref:Uncharacterized protein n=1 Tax=Apolygus lucorum TaxID=248454 RepID=A0A8S9XTR3_APOLU|nr:hypothetical protein GE061_012943 [Apolygus lucorum]
MEKNYTGGGGYKWHKEGTRWFAQPSFFESQAFDTVLLTNDWTDKVRKLITYETVALEHFKVNGRKMLTVERITGGEDWNMAYKVTEEYTIMKGGEEIVKIIGEAKRCTSPLDAPPSGIDPEMLHRRELLGN